MNTESLLKAIGGQANIAKECEVTDSAVSQWAKQDWIPGPRQQYLRLAHPGQHWADYDTYLDGRKGPIAAQEA